MDAGDWIAVGAAVIALLAFGATLWQAREATAARRTADAAYAIAQQVEADRQLDRKAEQDARDAPDFSVDTQIDMGADAVIVELRMHPGPDLDHVDVAASGPNIRGVSSPAGTVNGSPAFLWHPVSAAEPKAVRIDAIDADKPIRALLRLKCHERGSTRHWVKEYAIDV